MAEKWKVSPWVAGHRGRVSFGLQAFASQKSLFPQQDLLAAGRLAETVGLDAFFIGDHPSRSLECWLHLAALATQTRRIYLGSIVNCVFYRHPLMLARLAADLDNLSGGRALLGLGIGWDEKEFNQLGVPFLPARQRQAGLEEAIAILKGAWGEAPFSFEGRYFQAQDVQTRPSPLQRPYPPILIAGGGEKVTLRQVAQHADACNFTSLDLAGEVRTPEDVRRKLAALRAHCERFERPYDSILRTYMTGWLILAPDEASLRDKVESYFPEGIEKRFSGAWSGFVKAFTPEQAVDYYQSLADAGIQYFVIQTSDAADEETVRLLAGQVAPEVK
jgi:alkanesulfonate monooxygenase SsuD/methylene tetrahydromethanopterin reductase-like flavin-dependent oxidoreductase (luciferase family)